jgi:hypothetical protein
VHNQPGPNSGTGPLLAGLVFTLVRGLADLEVPALKRGQDADSGFLWVRGCEAGHQATVFSFDGLNPIQRQQASRSGSVTCDGDDEVGHAETLLPQPGGFAHRNDKWFSDVGRLQVSVLLHLVSVKTIARKAKLSGNKVIRKLHLKRPPVRRCPRHRRSSS